MLETVFDPQVIDEVRSAKSVVYENVKLKC